ncbi:small ribosomal subunit protein eS17 isoform X2 [Maniola hyperantus]|uniref:small ribosomal subunit protein eS17 isoform X2 n=1 Tax=Aphantopus hyperantus TaxID=2795564 RepID=UPI00374A7AF1
MHLFFCSVHTRKFLPSTTTITWQASLSPVEMSMAACEMWNGFSTTWVYRLFGSIINPVKNNGRVRTKTVKKAAKIIIEKYYTRLTLDFHTNKRICEEIAIIPTKPLRNKIAGFTTHLMRRLRHSQVRGISIKLQEEERERRDNFVPEVSALEHDIIEVDPDTKDMLKMLDFTNINGLQLTQPATQGGYGGRRN